MRHAGEGVLDKESRTWLTVPMTNTDTLPSTRSTTRGFYALVDGRYRKQCGKCGGTGFIPHYAGIFNGVCFQCDGGKYTGTGYTPENLEKAITRWAAEDEAARIKREADEAVFLAKARDRDHAYALKMNESFDARKLNPAEYIADEGQKVTFTGEVVLDKVIDTQYGSSVLLIVKVSETVTVKMFTTAQWVWDLRDEWDARVSSGDESAHTVTITATVKKNEEYNGQKQSQMVRPKYLPS